MEVWWPFLLVGYIIISYVAVETTSKDGQGPRKICKTYANNDALLCSMKPRNWLSWLSLAKGVIFRFHHVPSTFSTEQLSHCHRFCPPGDRAVRPLLRMINFLGDAPILTRAAGHAQESTGNSSQCMHWTTSGITVHPSIPPVTLR